MKVIAFILSAYLLFLFAVPCCSFDNCPREKTAQTQEHEKGDGPASPAGRDCGNCSPFFTCTGCSGFTVTVCEINSALSPFFPSNQYADYIVSPTVEADHDFWQPPKIG